MNAGWIIALAILTVLLMPAYVYVLSAAAYAGKLWMLRRITRGFIQEWEDHVSQG